MAEAPPAPKHPNERRFEEFFVQDNYVTLKNYLYNYLERKRIINQVIARDAPELVLEVGSGLSPIVTDTDGVVYSELSFQALQTLKGLNGRGHYVVADGTRLPFKTGGLSHVICSEVLEHIEDDQAAINELARVLQSRGLACITVPHRKFYFAADDRFVRHFRRYEIDEMRGKLDTGGFQLRAMTKVLGPLEKITMFSLVMTFSMLGRLRGNGNEGSGKSNGGGAMLRMIRPIFKWSHRAYAILARIDAKIMPRALSTVILFEAVRKDPDA